MSEFAHYNSPEAREQRHQQTIALRRAAFAPVREELARRGIECPMASDLPKFAPLSDEIVELLLAKVDDMARIEPVVAEMMVRALALAANKFDGTILQRVMRRELATGLEFALANTLLLAKPRNVSADAMKHAKQLVLKK
jgi:hypothetical protein